MKIAISHWQGRISPVFDESRQLLLIETRNGREINRAREKLRHANPLTRARFVAGLGTEILICGAVSVTLERALLAENIKVFAYTCGPVKEVIEAFKNNRLSDPEFLMPGCHGKKRPEMIWDRQNLKLNR